MISKIIREDGITELANIKSVTYTTTVNAGENLRPGDVCSSSIDVVCYGDWEDAPVAGEKLTYYQVVAGTEKLIGEFYAEPSIPSRNTFSFVAYDSVAKLNISYSERLEAIQSNFPMTLYDLVADVCSFAGVTLGSNSFPMSTMLVEDFYADGLTCRNILQYASEIACRFVRANDVGEIVFDWYTANSTSVYPGGDEAGKVAYKQNGLKYSNYVVYPVDSVAVTPVGVEGAAYIYPSTYSSITVSDPNGDGNIIISNLAFSEDGNGNLVLIVPAVDDGNANVTLGAEGAAYNPLTIGDNILLLGASEATYNEVAENIYTEMSALPIYRYATVQLFADTAPFTAGEFVNVTDANGVSFITPVFTMVVSANGAEIQSSGNRTYKENSSGVNRELANLSAKVIKFERDVVFKSNLTDGETVISGDNIKTGTISANRMDLFGKMAVCDPVQNSDGSIYYDPVTGEQVSTNIVGGYIGKDEGVTTVPTSLLDGVTYEAGGINNYTGLDEIESGLFRTVGYIELPDGLDSINVSITPAVAGIKIMEYAEESGTYTYQNKYNGITNTTDPAYITNSIALSDGTTHIRVCVRVSALSDTSNADVWVYTEEPTLGMTIADASDENYIIVTNNDTSDQSRIINGGIRATTIRHYIENGEVMSERSDVYMANSHVVFDANVVFNKGVRFATIYKNPNPSLSQSAYDLDVVDISEFSMFYVECCWSTGYTAHRAGTWVYVPNGGTVIAHPSVDWYQGSYDAHVYRQVTIDRSAGSISLGIGNRATGSGVTEGAGYAIITHIFAT